MAASKCPTIKLLFLQTQNNFYLILYVCIISTLHFSCNQSPHFNLKNGDLLFQDLDSSPLCDAIEQVTTGIDNLNFSHIGVLVIINNENYVLEAFNNGVDTVDLKTFLNRSLDHNQNPKVVIGRLKKQYTELIPNAIQTGFSLIGKNYDPEFKINNDKFYCSELIYTMFLEANNQNPFFYLDEMTYKKNGKTLDIWTNYFEQLNMPIPENEPGINPGSISLSDKIEVVYNYMY